MELAQEQNVSLVGVTEADEPTVEAYVWQHGWGFPILANASEAHQAWGVRMIWGNVVKLVDPDGRVAAEGIGSAAKVLAARPTQP